MPGKTLIEIRDLGKRMAEKRGHKIRRWNRQRSFRYTAICEKCRANLSAFARTIETPGMPESLSEGGILVARDRDQYWTEVDYNWADGTALSTYCSLPRP